MVIIGLGSNIGDRAGYLTAAVRGLGALLANMRLSHIYESKAVLLPGATPDMDLPYLNMAVSGDTALTPQALLGELKALEHSIGRVYRAVWGPREIDLDILAMDSLVMQTENLNVPHKELLNRDFALLPLADVSGNWRYPEGEFKGFTAEEIILVKGYGLHAHLRDTGIRLNV